MSWHLERFVEEECSRWLSLTDLHIFNCLQAWTNAQTRERGCEKVKRRAIKNRKTDQRRGTEWEERKWSQRNKDRWEGKGEGRRRIAPSEAVCGRRPVNWWCVLALGATGDSVPPLSQLHAKSRAVWHVQCDMQISRRRRLTTSKFICQPFAKRSCHTRLVWASLLSCLVVAVAKILVDFLNGEPFFHLNKGFETLSTHLVMTGPTASVTFVCASQSHERTSVLWSTWINISKDSRSHQLPED